MEGGVVRGERLEEAGRRRRSLRVIGAEMWRSEMRTAWRRCVVMLKIHTLREKNNCLVGLTDVANSKSNLQPSAKSLPNKIYLTSDGNEHETFSVRC